MKMTKRKALAFAVSSGFVVAPVASVAQPEVYGLIDIGLENYNDDDGIGSEIFQGFNSVDGNSDNRDFTLSNGMTSRLGVRGQEDLGVGGLKASYNLEFALDVLDGEGGNASAGNLSTRLGWAAIGGDWGMVKVGTQWMSLFEFGGWNTHRTDTHGYGTYYYTTGELNNSLQFGFRQDSAISYQYGSAWGHSDPFAFNVTLGIGEGSGESEALTEEIITEQGTRADIVTQAATGVSNENGVTSFSVAAQYSFDKRISVNAVYIKEFNDYDPADFNDPSEADAFNREPELINLGGRWSLTDAFELGLNYTLIDLDDADGTDRDSLAFGSFYTFNDQWDGHLGIANGSDDRDEDVVEAGRDIDYNLYGFIKRHLSDRTNLRVEFERIDYDGEAVNNGEATIAMLALQHNF